MRYAVISDIHGNLPAFEAVLADARGEGIDRFIIAGDYCLSGHYPDGCITALRELENACIIRGNEEGYFERLKGADQSEWTDGQMQISYWCFRNISDENMEYIGRLPHTAETAAGSRRIHTAHSVKHFIGREMLSSSEFAKNLAGKTVTREMLDSYVREAITGDAELTKVISALPDGIYIFGHSHIQFSYKAEGREVFLINPGSCGLPLDGITDGVPYTVLDISDSGEVSIEQHRVPFDTRGYIETLKASPQYREANVWSRVIIKELSTAKEHLMFFLAFAEEYARSIGDSRRPFAAVTWEKAFELWEKSFSDT